MKATSLVSDEVSRRAQFAKVENLRGKRLNYRGVLLSPAFGLILGTMAVGGMGVFGCSAQVGDAPTDPNPSGSGGSNPGGGSGGTFSGGGTGGNGQVGAGTGGSPVGAATGGSGVGPGAGGSGPNPGTGGTTVNACTPGNVSPGKAPIRRLTHFEYNNTIKDLLNDASSPGNALPSETLSDGTAVFGNNADFQSVSTLLVEQYGTVAEGIAQRATASAMALGALAPCGSTITATTAPAMEETCARNIVTALVPRAYRRALTTVETQEFVDLYKSIRTGRTFASGIAGVIEAVLQAPDFLYRVEFGVADPARPSVKRPTGYEMATRLSYLFWGTMPDAPLTMAAASGGLNTAEGVATQAKRLLDTTAKSRPIVGFFFNNLLPISALPQLQRDATHFPMFNPTIGNLMHQETQRFIEYEIFEAGSGTWPGMLTAPYTFLNEALAKYYGMTGVTGTAFQKVNLDPKKRVGILSQGSVMAGSTISNETSPVLRGGFIAQKLMCKEIPLPTGALAELAKPPDPFSAPTARERFKKHSADVVCASCHQYMDPMGLALENYDPVGQWRDQENNVTIDSSGSVPGTTGATNGPVEMLQKLATAEATQTCFATQWLKYAYGRKMAATEDACTQQTVQTAFKASGYNVKQLLLALTQTDAFLYLPAQ